MKKITLLAAFFIGASVLTAGPARYSRIKVFVPDRQALVKIWESGIDQEGSSGKIGGWMEFVVGGNDLQRLSNKNVAYSIVVEDLQREDQKHLLRGPQNALGFGYGSMGGYYTYAEVVQQLDSMQSEYPNLITPRDAIASSWEGRALWIVKISNNAAVDDPGKPEVLYTGLHHAREPEGMMTIVYYMWWLLENYGTDPDATYLLNNRQIWFLPVFNPDGYVYNQTTNPGGGGYWRKNRRNNGDGTYGVDLNRNYGNRAMWDSPYGGSDPYPYTSSDVYRGPGPFSEPETGGILMWLGVHNIKTCLNYHTFGDDIVYPWGYLPWETPDSVIFRLFCFDLTGYNRYVSGTDMQTVGYVTRGNSDDYMYGDTTKPRTFAMTPEVGPSFWPASNLILPLAVENLEPNKYYSYVAGQYTVAMGFSLAGQNQGGGIERSGSFTLAVTLKNKGLGDAHKIQAHVSTPDPDIVWSADADSLSLLPAQAEDPVTFIGSLNPGTSDGGAIEFIVSITDSLGYLHHDTLSTFLGSPQTLFADSGNGGTSNWDTGLGWGMTPTAHTAPSAFTDSPLGNYSSNTNNALTLKQPIDLKGYPHIVLKYWTQWQIEPTYDIAYVEASSDSGVSWSTLRSTLSHSGSGSGVQTIGTWGFDGYTPGMTWVEQESDLSAYAGSRLLIRFRLVSDASSERDGIYVDDITVVGYSDSLAAGVFGISFRPRWNIVSVPVLVPDMRKISLFQHSYGPAYGFVTGAGYVVRDTLLPGRGYWINFPSADTLGIIGTPVLAETLAVREGWNLVGSISASIPASSVMCEPSGLISSQFFGYAGRYIPVDTLRPGNGYWVKVQSDGELVLSPVPGSLTQASRRGHIKIVQTSELPPMPPGEATADVQAIPKEFGLDQNFPNPFNPTTTIRYQLPVESKVTMKIYDMLGRSVAVLVDGVQGAGYKVIEWNGAGVSSGVYMCRLEAAGVAKTGETFVQLKKILLLK